MAADPWCRVLVVEHGEDLWGAQQYLLRLAPLMRSHGVHQILAAPAGSAVAREWRARGLPQVHLPVPSGRSIRTRDGRLSLARAAREAARTGSGAWQVAQLARQVRADVIHANSHWSHLEVVTAARLTSRAAVVHLHELSERDALGRLRALAVLGADAAIGVSAAVAGSLPPRAARAVRVVQNGVDTEKFQPGAPLPDVRSQLTDDPRAPVVLVVARLEPRKGILDVVRAVAGLPPDLARTRLAIVGASPDPGYEASLRELATGLLGARVRFLGMRPDVDDLMRAADLLVLASESEGLALCVLEAQACGRPVAAYPAGGVGGLIEHEVTGLLARQGDVADLGCQISRLLEDPGLAARLGSMARDRVLASATLQHQVDAHIAVLREVIGRRAAGDRRRPAQRGHDE